MSFDKRALVLGATGAVGKALLVDLLKSKAFKTVTTIGRKEFEYIGPRKEALIQKVVNFDKLEDYKEAFTGPYDMVFCTSSTKTEIGSAEDFITTDKDYVINVAKLIKQQNPSNEIQFFYCSSAGANLNLSFLYLETKGEIERELTNIGFERVCIFRPGFLKTDKIRDKTGYIERLFVYLINWIDYIFPKKAIVHVDVLSKAIRKVATEDFDTDDVETSINDNGTLVEEINHKKIHEIGC